MGLILELHIALGENKVMNVEVLFKIDIKKTMEKHLWKSGNLANLQTNLTAYFCSIIMI